MPETGYCYISMFLININNKIKQLFGSEFNRNIFTVFSGTSINQIIPLLILPILTRIYPEDVFGVFILYSSTVFVLSMAASLKYELAIVLAENERSAFNLLVLSILIVLMSSVALFIIVSFFGSSIAKLMGNIIIEKWLSWIPLSILFVGLFQVFNYWYNRSKQYKAVAKGKVVKSVSSSGAYLGLGYAGYIGSGLIVGVITGQVLSGIYIVLFSLKTLKKQVKYFSWKNMFRLMKKFKDIPFFNTLINLVNTLSSHLPVFMLTSFFGLSYAGFYGLANRVIKTPMGLVQTSVGEVLFQEVSDMYRQRKEIYAFIKKMYLKLLKIAVVPFIILLVSAPYLFKIIFGSEWVIAGHFSQLIIPWLFLAFLNSPVSRIVTILNKQKEMLYYNLLLIVLRAAGLYLGYKLFNNVMYAIALFAFAGFIGNVFLVFYLMYISKKAYKREVYNG